MCGIFGFNHGKDDKASKIFFHLLKHRGPDGNGSTMVGDWYLGHLRLAIIDTSSKANQPMTIDGGSIVFNGEIFNYVELRKKYFRGVRLKTNSDTEILLRLLQKFGPKILNELNGMFAFAWYNTRDQKLTLVRDRFGVKPLYWMKKKSIFYFSSEVKPLTKIFGKIEFNKKAVREFMKNVITDYGQKTFINSVKSVKPGHFIEVGPDSTREVKWYDFHDSKIDPKVLSSFESAAKYFEDLLVDSIRIRLRSDVPLCITLSGGVDSATIYTLLKERLKMPVHPICFIHPGRKTNEESKVERLVKPYAEKLVKVKEGKPYNLSSLRKVLFLLEFPIWNSSALAYYDTYKKIHNMGFKVVLEGHGADELLGGYPYMIELARKDLLKAGKIQRSFEIFKVYKETLNQSLDQKTNENYRNYYDYFQRYNAESSGHILPNIFEKELRSSFQKKILPIVLRAFDRMPMANSVECRCPYLDYRIVELCRALPLEYKVSELGNKAILRQILKKYGKSFIYEDMKKTGFSSFSPDFYKNNRKQITRIVNEYDNPDYKSIKEEALNKLKNRRFLWTDIAPIWKVLSLKMTKDIYSDNSSGLWTK